jgi:hypothetical protein
VVPEAFVCEVDRQHGYVLTRLPDSSIPAGQTGGNQ